MILFMLILIIFMIVLNCKFFHIIIISVKRVTVKSAGVVNPYFGAYFRTGVVVSDLIKVP